MDKLPNECYPEGPFMQVAFGMAHKQIGSVTFDSAYGTSKCHDAVPDPALQPCGAA